MVIIIINSNGVNSQSILVTSPLNILPNSKNSIASGSIDVHAHQMTINNALVVYHVSDANSFIMFDNRLITCFITHHLHTSTHAHHSSLLPALSHDQPAMPH